MTLLAAVGKSSIVKVVKPFFPLLVYAAVAGLLVTTYFSSFNQIETLIQEEKLNYLGSTAEEKAGQIAAWRDTQKRIGESFSRNSMLSAEFEQWLREGAPSNGHKQMLRQRLDELQYVNGYKSLILLDRQGRVRLLLPAGSALGAEDARLARQAMDNRKSLFSDFHRNSYGDKGISIDLVAPLIGADRGSGRVVGAAVLQIDPSRFLYPLIQAWPVPSASGETLLVRQDGNDVLFLNDLRHKTGTALSLRLPLATPKLPAAMAVKGERRTADGIDYRGIGVVAEMRSVPGTPWFVVSKVDREELFGPISQLQNWSIGIAMIYVAIGGLLVLAWLYGQKAQNKFLRVQHAAAVERAMLVKHFEYLTKYANDIIVVTDETGKIVEANVRAEKAYGYSRKELLGLRVPDLRDAAEDPAIFAGQVKQLQAAGELRYEARSRRKDGTIFPVEVSARLITVEGVRYMQGIIRDVSERKRAEEALRKSETLLKESQQLAHIGSWELDLKSNTLYWSDENYCIFEIDPARGASTYQTFLNAVHPDDRERVNEAYTGSVKNRTPFTIVHRLQFPGGRVKYVREWGETYYDEDGQPSRSIGTTQDVTEQQLAISELKRTEELMGRNNHLLETLFSSIHVMIAYLDSDFNFVKVNKAYAAANQRIPEFFPGRNHFDLFPNEENEAIFRKAVETGETVIYFAKPFEHPELGVTYWDWRLEPIMGPDGKVEGLIFSLLDVTAQQLAQNELRESARQIEDLYNHAPCGYHSLDKNGIIVQINDTELQWLGYAREEVTGKKNFVDMLAPASQQLFRSNYSGFKARGFVHDLEYELIRKDGTTFHVSLSATAIYDPAGEYLMSRSTLFDITERKLVEKKLEESEERFRTMADQAPIMIWLADAQAKPGYRGCNFFNQQWHDFTGLPLEWTQGRRWLEIVHPDDRKLCLEAYQRAFRKMRPFKREYRLRRYDGAFRWVLDSGVPRFTEEGGFLGFIGTCIDITDHKLFEDIREELEHVGRLNIAGEMASSLAHELSQPLSAANNYLDACLRRMEDSNWDKDSMQKAVMHAHGQTERAGAIINHLKNLVRKQKQERSMQEVNELIRDTLSFMDYELHHHFIKLSLELSPVPPVLGNRIELEQVLINLIKNAIDSMASSPRRDLRITTRVVESGAVMVSVRDTGKGIAADELDKMFDPFQTSKKDGLGLGLAICRSLIENYGGRIWAEQTGHGGAEFNFTLPAWSGS